MKKFYSIIVMACLSATPVLADFSDGVIAYSMGEYKQAYNTMRSLAETSDHGLAQYYVAMMYLKGNGVGAKLRRGGEMVSQVGRNSVSSRPSTGWESFI